MTVILFAPLDHDHLRLLLLLLFVHWVRHRALLGFYDRWLRWLLNRAFNWAVKALYHSWHFLFFTHFNIHHFNFFPPENLHFVLRLLLGVSILLLVFLELEVFWREIVRARVWPWLFHLHLLFLHLLGVALLSIMLVNLSPAADSLQLWMNIVDLFVFLARSTIHRAKFYLSLFRCAGIIYGPICF